MLKTRLLLALPLAAVCLLAGCPKRNPEFEAGIHAEAIQDYDTALVHYEHALHSNPTNGEYRLRTERARFEAGQFHIEQGQRALKGGDLNLALAEFRRAQTIDPSNSAADQNVKHTMQLLAEAKIAQAPNPAKHPQRTGPNLLSGPPSSNRCRANPSI
jgi:tetratricopeptide (TPR) repeat protein